MDHKSNVTNLIHYMFEHLASPLIFAGQFSYVN